MKKGYILLMFLLTSGFLMPVNAQSDNKHKFRLARRISVFNAIVKDLNMFYVDSIMPDKMINKGIQAMLSNLDPYTVYYPEEESEELKMMTTGKYAGVGSTIQFHKKKNTTVMTNPYVGMPAYEAGIRAGDEIVSIDGKSVKGMSVDSVSDMLRGDAGTRLTVIIKRPGTKNNLEFKLQRKSIAMPAITYYGLQNGNVGFIALESFTEGCAKEMRHTVVDLKKQGAESFVIDLRSNGGGLLEEAIDIVGLFIPKDKVVVTTKGKIAQSNESFKTEREPIDTISPIVVLVDGYTASASEIVAGALQDFDRAVIVGSRTFGKGLVQSTRPLPDGGYLKLTTAKYYIPSGRCVQALDYSHVIDDGKSTRIPDSLTNVFYTAAGREVRDGGGIRPDAEPKPEETTTLLYYLATEMAIFDYATEFKLKNETIAPAEEFTISDEEYEKFKEYLKSTGFKYDLASAKALEELKKIMDKEGLADIAKEEIAALEKKLQANLDHSLAHFDKYVRSLLSSEIVLRYYGEKGQAAHNLNFDEDLKLAYEILGDRDRYRKILTPANK